MHIQQNKSFSTIFFVFFVKNVEIFKWKCYNHQVNKLQRAVQKN